MLTPPPEPPRILLVEDDPDDARVSFAALRAGAYSPHHVRTGAEALEAAAQQPFAAVLVDYRLPDLSGIEVCKRIRAAGSHAPVILLSSVMSDSVVQRALEAGAAEFLLKDLGYGARLVAELQRVLEA